MPPSAHDRPRPARDGLLLLAGLLLAAVPALAEPLLTQVTYVEGTATYFLYGASGKPLSPGDGHPANLLRAGMELASGTRVDTAGDARVILSPSSQIRYLLFPKGRIINLSFSFNSADVRNTLDYRIRMERGNLVGDVQGPLRHVRNQVETEQGTAATGGGHFLISVADNGNTRYAVLAGTLTVTVTRHGVFVLGPMQMLNVLSDKERKRLVDGAGAALGGARPGEPGIPSTIVASLDNDLKVLPLSPDDPAFELLTTPFPQPNPDSIGGVLGLSGQQDTFVNPANFFLPNPANTSNNPPVSPIYP